MRTYLAYVSGLKEVEAREGRERTAVIKEELKCGKERKGSTESGYGTIKEGEVHRTEL